MTSSADTTPRLAAPSRGLRHHIAGAILRAGGWTMAGDPPDLPRYIIIAAPHTALADGVWMVAMAWWWGLRVDWLVKHTAARFPFGTALRWLGAIPVDRSSPQGLVRQLAAAFRERGSMLLVIPPEGTRHKRDHWRAGFYHIAREADVPVCLSYLDYGRRRGGFGPCFRLTGDFRADMDAIRAFYVDVQAAVPERFTPPRLREEDT